MFRTLILAGFAFFASMPTGTAQTLEYKEMTKLVPFTCNGTRYLSNGKNEANVGIGILTVASTTFNVAPQDWTVTTNNSSNGGATSGIRINGIAASSETGYIYATDHVLTGYQGSYAPVVLRIGRDTNGGLLNWEPLHLVPLPGQPQIFGEKLFGGTMVPAAAIDNLLVPSHSGEVYVAIGIADGQGVLAIIDVHPSSNGGDGTVLRRIRLTNVDTSPFQVGIGDIGFNPGDGLIYAWNQTAGTVITISPNTGVVSVVNTTNPSGITLPTIFGAYFERGTGQALIFGGTGGSQTNLYSLDYATAPPVIIGGFSSLIATADGFSVTDGTQMCGAAPQFTKEVSKGSVCGGDELTYTYTFTNNSNQALTGLHFTDNIDPAFDITNINVAGSSYTPAGNNISITGITVPANGQVVITVSVNAGAAGSFDNQATMSGLPVFFGETLVSDDPTTPADLDATVVAVEQCKGAKFTVRKVIDDSAWAIPPGVTFPMSISGCGSTPSSVTLINPAPLSATTLVNAGATCMVDEGTPTGVTLPENCSWKTTYDPGQSVLVSNGGAEVTVTNKVVCKPKFSTEHFQCYDIIERPEMNIPVDLADQFGETKNTVIRPKYLCTPVDKNGEGMENKTDHLLFYEIKEGRPVNKDVEVKNQFGIQKYRVLRPRLLGVPSTKKVIEKPGKIDFGLKKPALRLGASILYTIQVDNHGANLSVPPNTLKVVDYVPAGMIIQFAPSPSWACPTSTIQGPNVATCTWSGNSPITSGQLPPIQLIAYMPEGGQYSNCAEVIVGGGATDVHLQDNSNGNCVEREVDLGIEKRLVNGPLQIGDIAEFVIDVTNHGSGIDPTTNTILVPDLLPSGLVLDSNTGPWNCQVVGATSFGCTYIGTGQVNTNDVLTFSIFAKVLDRNGGVQCARVQIRGLNDENLSNNKDCIEVVVDTSNPRKVDLGLDKKLLNGPLQIGDTAEFEIAINNHGDPINVLPPLSLNVYDSLPPGFVYSGYSTTGPWSCPPAGANNPIVCTWNGGSPVPQGSLGSIILKAKVKGGKGGEQCAKVWVVGLSDDHPDDNSTCIRVGINPKPREVDLGVKKALLTKGPLVPGGTALFDVTVYNANGPIVAPYTITVNDTLPQGFNFVSGGASGWACSGTLGGFTCTLNAPANGPTLQTGWYSNLTILTNISKTKGGRQCAKVGITPQTDVNPNNNATCIPVVVGPRKQKVDLGIQKRLVNRAPLQPGDIAKFNIKVYNANGPISAPYNITVTDTLPPGLTLLSTGGNPQWNCAPVGGNTFTCTFNGPPPTTLQPGWSSTFAIKTKVGKKPGVGRQCAKVGITPQTDVNPNNNATCIPVVVGPRKQRVDLGIQKRLVNRAPLQPGDIAKFNIKVYNANGPISAPYNITVTDTLPPGLTLLSTGGNPQWNCAPVGGNTFTCTFNGPPPTTLQPGWSSTFAIKAKVGKKPGVGRQCAKVGITPQTDVNPNNNATCIPVVVKSITTGGGGGGYPLACVAGLRAANSTLNLRSTPSGNAKILGTLPMGTVLTILERKGKWLRVQLMIDGLKGPVGWVAQRFTRPVEKPAQCRKFMPEDTGSTTGTGTGTDGAPFACVAGLPKGDPFLNLRDEPSGGAKLIMPLPAGTAMIVLQRRGNWSKVQVMINGRKGPVGWLASRYTKAVRSPDSCKASSVTTEPRPVIKIPGVTLELPKLKP